MNPIYIVKGKVTDTECQPGSKLGDTEWQFSDGPAGSRSCSEDFISLEEGLRVYSGRTLVWDKSNDLPT